MSNVIISPKELLRIKQMESYLRGEVKQQALAENWNVTTRQVRRLKTAYLQQGAKALVHSLRGQPSNHQYDEQVMNEISEIIKKRHLNHTPTFVYESLTQIDYHYQVSLETIRKLMIKEGCWQPKAVKRVICHPLRERRRREGELVQADGSPDYYLGREFGECCLLVFIDDATGKYFVYLCDTENTLNYFRAMKPYFLKHGLPLAFYVDRFSVFSPTPKGEKEFANTTQFGRVCQELNIELIQASSPQAKGRVERANATLQGRLIPLFAQQQITSFHQANDYLQNFYVDFLNTKFALLPAESTNVSRQVDGQLLDQILVIKEERQLSKNLTCQHQGITYQFFPAPHQSYLSLQAKQKVQVITDLEETIHFQVQTPRGLTELPYQVVAKERITPVVSRKQIDIYLRKLAEAKPAIPQPKKFWD